VAVAILCLPQILTGARIVSVPITPMSTAFYGAGRYTSVKCTLWNSSSETQSITVSAFKNGGIDPGTVNSTMGLITDPAPEYTLPSNASIVLDWSAASSSDGPNLLPRGITFEVAEPNGQVRAACLFSNYNSTVSLTRINHIPVNGGRPF